MIHMEFLIILANHECQNNSNKFSQNGHILTTTKEKKKQSVLNLKKKNVRKIYQNFFSISDKNQRKNIKLFVNLNVIGFYLSFCVMFLCVSNYQFGSTLFYPEKFPYIRINQTYQNEISDHDMKRQTIFMIYIYKGAYQESLEVVCFHH